MRPALLPQRESGAVLYSSHAHRKNIREQMQTTPALPTQEHTGADADHPRTPDAGIHGSLFRPSRAAQLSYSHRCRAGHRVQAQPAGPLRAGLACRATACGLNLPGHWVRAQPAYRPLCTAVSFAYCSANSASFSIRRIAAGVSRDPSDARRPSARASRRGSSIA